MKKYLVSGTTEVVVTIEVWAHNEEHAKEIAYTERNSLTAYCGNGGYDKLVGVDGYYETVDIPCDIDWNDTELLEDNPEYFICPECEEECELNYTDKGVYYECPCCHGRWDEDGDEIYCEEDEDE